MISGDICDHCGRRCGTLAGGYGYANKMSLCHPNEQGRPDCYRLVTIYGHGRDCKECQVKKEKSVNEDKDIYCIALGKANEPIFQCSITEAVERLKDGEKIDALYLGLPYDETLTPAAFLEIFDKEK